MPTTTVTVYRPTLFGFVTTIVATAIGYTAGRVIWSVIRKERKKELDEIKEYIDMAMRENSK